VVNTVETRNNLKVVSLVPSLTETLLACGVEVVGRTRYCIHPTEAVSEIQIVGGTKSVHWQRIAELEPDLVIMDREENTREMADECQHSWHATHITSIETAASELQTLAEVVSSENLARLASDWQSIAEAEPQPFSSFAAIPGIEQVIGDTSQSFSRLEYMIWREPWMAVGPDTFIASVLKKVGLAEFLIAHPDPYPELQTILPEPDTFYLFSTEPYPFARHVEELESQGFTGALVDGEFFSWFGIRSYQKLKDHLNI